ncbi:MAG TPA: GntR family transcriptional regulator [Candidatus Elarobacter sp.]
MPPAFFAVDPHGGSPIYVQLADQIKRAIAVGALAPGERLPTVKALAIDLKVNANTVARVYRELEQEGVIATAPGRGSFVRDAATVEAAKRAAVDTVALAIDDAVREARSLGVTLPTVKTAVDASLVRWYSDKEEKE